MFFMGVVILRISAVTVQIPIRVSLARRPSLVCVIPLIRTMLLPELGMLKVTNGVLKQSRVLVVTTAWVMRIFSAARLSGLIR